MASGRLANTARASTRSRCAVAAIRREQMRGDSLPSFRPRIAIVLVGFMWALASVTRMREGPNVPHILALSYGAVRNHRPMNFGRSIEDPVAACVAIEAFDRRGAAVSEAPEYLHGSVRHAAKRFRGRHLHHRDPIVCVPALVDLPGRAMQEQARAVDLDRAVGDHLLHHLERADLLAELAPVPRVLGEQRHQPAGLADGPCADLCETRTAHRALHEGQS